MSGSARISISVSEQRRVGRLDPGAVVVADDERDRRLVRHRDVERLLRLDHVGRRRLDGRDGLVQVEVRAGGDREAERGDDEERDEQDPADEPGTARAAAAGAAGSG